MPVTEELLPVAQQISNQLGDIVSFSRLRTRAYPYWYGRMLTEVVLLVEGDELVYVTGRHENTDAEIVVVTQNRIVRSTASEIANGNATTVSESWPRRRVAAVGASADESVFSGEPFTDWPGHLSVRLSIIDGPKISLPLERISSGGKSEDDALRTILRATLTSLAEP